MAELSDSPDVDFARDRLGNLLERIRSQSVVPAGTTSNGKKSSPRDDDDEPDGSDYDSGDYDERQSSSRKRRRPTQKKIIFELRQKAFEVQNCTIEHGLYALCRIWMRGKDNRDSIVSGQPSDRSASDSQESLMAARIINRKTSVRPEANREDGTTVTGEEESAADILNQYLPRWRKVKREWCEQRSQEDADKYGDSLRVLREMHATAQSHVISL